MTLTDLAEKYNTDKVGHGYMPYYEKYMPKFPSSILEIGCMHGASLRMWKEFYPEAYIHVLDLFENPEFASEDEMRAEGFFTYKGDQSDVAMLNKINGLFDVIIDDGSHAANHQVISLSQLFVNSLRPAGLYVVEDLHCNVDPFFWNGVKCKEDTLLESVKRANSWFWLTLGHMIQRWELHDDKILFIWKK